MGAEGCRLYLVAPGASGSSHTGALPADFPNLLAAALDAGDVAAVRLGPADAVMLAAVRQVAVSRGVALFLDGSVRQAADGRCDGVHVQDPAEARGAGDLQVGVFCGLSRDAAMIAGEAGADYVAFGPFDATPSGEALDLLAWWAELMEVPCVAEGGVSLENCAMLARAGADFVAAGDAVWNDPAGPAAAVRALNAAIAAA